MLYLNHIKKKEGHYNAQNERQQNSPKLTNDYVAQIAEKQESMASLNAEIASMTANIDTLKADLKGKKIALKAAEKEVIKLEVKRAKAVFHGIDTSFCSVSIYYEGLLK